MTSECEGRGFARDIGFRVSMIEPDTPKQKNPECKSKNVCPRTGRDGSEIEV
jgi:hypothetical protein